MIQKQEKELNRLERLLSILNHFEHNEVVSTKDLADNYSVSLRTAQRDLEQLQRAGFPLIEYERGEYAFEDGFSLSKIKLNEEEISLLTFMDSLLRSMGLPFENAFRSLYKKCLSDEYDSSFYAKLPHLIKNKESYSFINDLDRAIDNCVDVSVTYADKKKNRVVSPLKIVYFEGFWYLLAKDNERSKVITFRLDNINSISLTAKHFLHNDDVDAILNDSVNVWFSGQRNKEVMIEVSSSVAHYFKARNYFPLQKIINEYDDGKLLLSTYVSDYREILTIIFSWLPNLVVVKPIELSNKIAQQVKDYLAAL